MFCPLSIGTGTVLNPDCPWFACTQAFDQPLASCSACTSAAKPVRAYGQKTQQQQQQRPQGQNLIKASIRPY